MRRSALLWIFAPICIYIICSSLNSQFSRSSNLFASRQLLPNYPERDFNWYLFYYNDTELWTEAPKQLVSGVSPDVVFEGFWIALGSSPSFRHTNDSVSEIFNSNPLADDSIGGDFELLAGLLSQPGVLITFPADSDFEDLGLPASPSCSEVYDCLFYLSLDLGSPEPDRGSDIDVLGNPDIWGEYIQECFTSRASDPESRNPGNYSLPMQDVICPIHLTNISFKDNSIKYRTSCDTPSYAPGAADWNFESTDDHLKSFSQWRTGQCSP